MTEQEIKENAPEGATGYRHPEFSPDSIVYYKRNQEGLFTWCFGEWLPSSNQEYKIKPL